MGASITVLVGFSTMLLAGMIEDFIRWCKWIIAYYYIALFQRTTKKRFDLYDTEAYHDPVKCGLLPPQEEIVLESPCPESRLYTANDEVYFYGVNSSSECLVTRISRHCNGETKAWIYLKLKDGKEYKLRDKCRQPQPKDGDKCFECGGLKIYFTEPMRKWRIFYKGLLKEVSDDGEKMVYIKFALQWRAATDCFDTLSDIDRSSLAREFSMTRWEGKLPDLKGFHNAVNSYSQGGVIRGEVSIGDNENQEIYLFGQKTRYLGNISMIKDTKFSNISGHISKNGIIFNFTEISIPNIVVNFRFGHIVTPEGKVEAATNITKREVGSRERKDFVLGFHADDLKYSLAVNVEEKDALLDSKWNKYQLSIRNTTTELQSYPGIGVHSNKSISYEGNGVFLEGNILNAQKTGAPQPTARSTSKDIPLVVNLCDDLCPNSDITGGKGSSLGRLSQMSKTYQTFIVPKGIVVTTFAYKKFITEDILKEVKDLEDTLYGNVAGDVKSSCKRVADAVVKTDVPSQVSDLLVRCLTNEFGDSFHQKMFAVRSSATGEDTEDMSAAGQMETYLGVSGIDHIISSVKKCWASQFGYVAVQYKRQNGQVLDTPMAVVIQEMVLSDVAGVLFTCDPLTGNPTLMTITANYGLGESVVSGSEEPDTIVLERDAKDELSVKEKSIGAKSRRVVIKDEKGTSEEEVPESQRKSFSLSDSLSIRLGNVAVNIEKSYGSSRDIEWGYWNNNLYIFQCRPVTSNAGETDYEIDHENDAPMRVENEYFTVCNVGEVMPGATTPLSQDVVQKFFNATIQRKFFTRWRQFSPRYYQKGVTTMYNHIMMTVCELFEQFNEDNLMVKASMISLFGRILEDDQLFDLIRERYGRRKATASPFKLFFLFKDLLFTHSRLKSAQKSYESYRIPIEESKTARALFDVLLFSCTDPTEAMIVHMFCSNKSTMSNVLLMSTLEKGKRELNTDVFSDVSVLLSSISEVESADVPSALENLAFHVYKDIDPSEFQKMNPKEAKDWLISSSSESGKMFRDFLKKHGHRCLKEFDLQIPTWEDNPEHMIKMLQKMSGSITEERIKKKNKSFNEIISMLKTELSTFRKFILRVFILPLSRSGVQDREASKSLIVKTIHEWRKGYKRLGKLMVAEGRIPDEDLIYFMSLFELHNLFDTRSPKIISRAAHRRRRHKILESYIFPEIMSGMPKPINMDDNENLQIDENASMKGLPVSQGTAKGFARVAVTLEEASLLKPGEILLTYSTDIGWSPYFPALAGVGTELGGLISHGAVVSREYGLPCVAGLHGVTRQFKTGDYVLLDGNKGILQKLAPPE